jgi:hypothetical protein
MQVSKQPFWQNGVLKGLERVAKCAATAVTAQQERGVTIKDTDITLPMDIEFMAVKRQVAVVVKLAEDKGWVPRGSINLVELKGEVDGIDPQYEADVEAFWAMTGELGGMPGNEEAVAAALKKIREGRQPDASGSSQRE